MGGRDRTHQLVARTINCKFWLGTLKLGMKSPGNIELRT
jgi:hypothetical protein